LVETVASERDLSKGTEGWQRHEDDLTTVSEVLGRSRPPRLPLQQRLHRRLVDIVHGQIVARIEQLMGHGLPHVTDAQISCFHVPSPPAFSNRANPSRGRKFLKRS